jgi:hypothetical protein
MGLFTRHPTIRPPLAVSGDQTAVLATLGELSSKVETKITALSAAVATLQQENAALKTEVAGLQKENSNLQHDVNDVIANHRKEVDQLAKTGHDLLKRTQETADRLTAEFKTRTQAIMDRSRTSVERLLGFTPQIHKIGFRTTIENRAFLGFIAGLYTFMFFMEFTYAPFWLWVGVMGLLILFIMDKGLSFVTACLRVSSDVTLTDEDRQLRIEYLTYKFLGIRGQLKGVDTKQFEKEFEGPHFFKGEISIWGFLLYIIMLFLFMFFMSAIQPTEMQILWWNTSSPAFNVICYITLWTVVAILRINKESVVEFAVSIIQLLKKKNFTPAQRMGLLTEVIFKFWGMLVDASELVKIAETKEQRGHSVSQILRTLDSATPKSSDQEKKAGTQIQFPPISTTSPFPLPSPPPPAPPHPK